SVGPVAPDYVPSLRQQCQHKDQTKVGNWAHRDSVLHFTREESDHGFGLGRSEPTQFPMARTSFIDHSMTNETAKPKLKNGVKIGEGDGTVSLISLGAMCVEGWRRKRWNPAGIKVPHQPEAYHFRGGASSGDHIDILGGTPLNEIVGKVATGAGDQVPENLISNIK
ncbi:10705_t:CDS:2, partial [Acaulospora colombiana]